MSIFSKVAAPKVRTSNFNLSEESKLSMNFGDLVPILCKETLPSDRWSISTELLIKLAPLKAPVMHRIKAYVHYFFVPNFQITDVFADFINPKVNTQNSILLPYTSPKVLNQYGQNNGSLFGSLTDYFGLPITQTSWLNQSGADGGYVSVLPYMAYQHIYNSYYRDQNMEVLEGADAASTSLFLVEDYKKIQGLLSTTTSANKQQLRNLFTLRHRAWAKDYFTSALPTPQAGDDVLLPMTGSAPVSGFFDLDLNPALGNTKVVSNSGTKSLADANGGILSAKEGGLNADLSAATGTVSINDLRKALALQRFKELAERGGTRYPEMVRNFFNAYLPDFWVDRPIYLGGQVQPLQIGEVVQTSQSTDGESGSAQGYRAGIGSSYGKTKTVSFKCPCHGFVIGILSIRPEATYQQGVERMWSRKSMFDYPFPQFANLGEQPILNKEIFAQGSLADEGVFGYTPCYADWKEGHTHVCGEFRSSLDYWHFGRQFANLPTLSKQFVQMDNVSYKPFNVTDDQTEHVYVNLYNRIHTRRPLPYFGTPSII